MSEETSNATALDDEEASTGREPHVLRAPFPWPSGSEERVARHP